MSNDTGATAPSEQSADGPLSLDDLFKAELASGQAAASDRPTDSDSDQAAASDQAADHPDSPEDLASPHCVEPGSPVSATSFDTPASSSSKLTFSG